MTRRFWPPAQVPVPYVFLAGLYVAERGIGVSLVNLTHGALPWPAIKVDPAIAWAQRQLGIAGAGSGHNRVLPNRHELGANGTEAHFMGLDRGIPVPFVQVSDPSPSGQLPI